MTAEVLTARRLNRAMLARQLLLERRRLSIPDATARIAGIQNQYAPNAYLRLFAMLDGFARGDLTQAYERGDVVQATLLRGTIHTVAAADYALFAAAIRETQREWASRVYRDEAADRAALVRRVTAALGGRPHDRAASMGLLDGASRSAAATIHTDAEVIRWPPSGTWEQRRAHTFGLAQDLIGDAERPTEAQAIDHLVGRYLGAFGPAAPKDVQAFTGLPMSRLKPAFGRLELVRYRDAEGRELLDVPDGELPPEDTPAPVRFLPTWDAMLLVHARRTGILEEAYRKVIFNTKMPPSYPTVLVEGRVVGTWKHIDGRIAIDWFEAVPPRARREAGEESERLADFHG